ncbi:Uncharacterised protein [Cedecea lapagei]|uniref:Uncharacterized protein n=1 Tax=Cedecea lapagei TaxID=158823 RepID=A0A447UZ14_9ENTR|nr:hypothetical protein [Cedecea lapagei]VEB95939.1 Uncharacterised protein [Cedecea lapagei]
MPVLIMLITLLRKLIRLIISIFLISTPLMAADLSGLKSSDSLFSTQDNKVCYNTICLGANDNHRLPDLFRKTDRFSRRAQTDLWSTYDFDHSDTGIRISVGL